jgi:hypothetical protein
MLLLLLRSSASLVAALATLSCATTESELSDRGPGSVSAGGGDDDGAGGAGAGTIDPATCAPGKKLVGYGGTDLTAARAVAAPGIDRARVKPHDALPGEYTRLFGKVPASLAKADGAFGSVPPRWFDEPTVSGTTIFVSYRIAYEACLDFNPSGAGWPERCASMQRKFWSRTPAPAEIQECVDVATAAAADHPAAHACASVLVAGGFVTY